MYFKLLFINHCITSLTSRGKRDMYSINLMGIDSNQNGFTNNCARQKRHIKYSKGKTTLNAAEIIKNVFWRNMIIDFFCAGKTFFLRENWEKILFLRCIKMDRCALKFYLLFDQFLRIMLIYWIMTDKSSNLLYSRKSCPEKTFMGLFKFSLIAQSYILLVGKKIYLRSVQWW